MDIPLRQWNRGSRLTAADLNRLTEAIKRATPIAGSGISVSRGLGGSVISFVGRSGNGGGASTDEDFPFRIQRVNSGTDVSPSWHTLVYIPEYAITARFNISSSGMSQYAPSDMPDWYEFQNSTGGLGPVCLHVRVVNAGTTACYWRLGGLTPEAGWPGGEGVVTLRTYVMPLGVVSGGGTGEAAIGEISQLVSSAIYVAADFVGTPSGGGGTEVVVDDERTDTSAPGVVGYGGTAQDGTVSLIARDGIGPDVVFFMAGGTTIGTLVDYLAGRLDFEDDQTFGGLGKNVNTETFADECLGPAETPDVPGEGEDPSGLAAPSAHTHTLSQFTNDDGAELDAQSIIDWFSNVGMWDALGETGPSGEPSENSLLTVGDIEDDPTYFKTDSATPSAGSVTTDLLALSGHRHPLNVADISAATGPTGETPTPPPANNYIQPVGVGTTGPSGEPSPTSAMHGSSPYYARADHVHPICEEMGPTGAGYSGIAGPSGGIDKSMADGSGDFGGTGQTLPTGVTLDTNAWVPGQSGYVESYCTRIVKVEDEFGVTTRYAIFRRRKVSRTGQVVWVGPEYAGFVLART